jgi:hypothetical protein
MAFVVAELNPLVFPIANIFSFGFNSNGWPIFHLADANLLITLMRTS